MAESNANPSSSTGPGVKFEQSNMFCPGSPVPSDISTVTTRISGISDRPVSPTPSTSSSVHSTHGKISLRPLSSILEPDDQMSIVGEPASGGGERCPQPSMSPRVQPVTSSADVEENTTQFDWRRSCNSITDSLNHILYNDGLYQDIVFEVQGERVKEQFKAHKLIMRVASSVFDRMFRKSDTGQTSSSQFATVIPITNVDPATFKIILHFMYKDEVDLRSMGSEQLLEVFKASVNYELHRLYAKCVRQFRRNLPNNIVIKLCEIVAEKGDDQVLDICLNHLARDATKLFLMDDFSHLSKENLGRLLDRDDLNIDEVSLFEAVIRWVEYHCMLEGQKIDDPREILSDLKFKIRFPLMQPQDLSLKVAPTSFLTPEELSGVFAYVCVPVSDRDKVALPPFPTTPRCFRIDSSDDMSDITEGTKSAEFPSPQRRGSIASTAITDNETASTVSSHVSESRKRPKKVLKRGSSPTKAKRRKNDVSRPQNIYQIDDLFGESDRTIIQYKNETLQSLSSFIGDCRKRKNKKEIEKIILDNVKFEDCSIQEYLKIDFPKLHQFYLNIEISEVGKAFEKFCIKKFLFFKKSEKEMRYETLWDLGIHVTVIINKVILLDLDPLSSHLTLNKFIEGNEILTRNLDLKSIVYSHATLNKNFPSSLKRLAVMGIKNDDLNSEEFLQKFRILQDLTITSVATDPITCKITAGLPCKDKLRKLRLGCATLVIEPTIRFPNLKRINLWRVAVDRNFEKRFRDTFPYVEEVAFLGPMEASNLLLQNIFKCTNLNKIISCGCDWKFADIENRNRTKAFVYDTCRLDYEKNEKNFIIQRTGDSAWKGHRITNKDYNTYNLLGYNALYSDIQSFMPYLKSRSHDE